MAGAYLKVSQSHLERDRPSILVSLDFPVWTKASVGLNCAMLIQRQNDVNNKGSSIQFM